MDLIKGEDEPLYVRNCWYVAAWDYELGPEAPIARMIINEPLVLYRKPDGHPVALADQCCHRLAPLSTGRVEGGDLRCMYHGLKYDPSGRCVEIPGQDSVPPQMRVRSYPVVQRHSWIWVWMGDPALADPALIPPAAGLDDPDWVLRPGRLDHRANYLLIGDNITDFSHIAYVHEKTFGGGRDVHARTHPRIAPLERGVRISRWMPDSPTRGFIVDDSITVADRWYSYDFLVPGILLMRTEVHPSGTASALGFEKPVTAPLHADFTSQALTPMTDDTTRYYYSWGPSAREHAADPRMLDAMLAMMDAAFEEDRRTIEAQQRSINLGTGAGINAIAHDRGPTMFRRVLDRMIREETAPERRATTAV